MTATTSKRVAAIALQQDEGEALWFLGFLVTIKASSETTDGRVAVMEHLAPRVPARRCTSTTTRTSGSTSPRAS